jgi:plastocyanin
VGTRELRLAFHAACLLLAPLAQGAALELKLLGVDGAGVAGTVVTLRSTDAGRPLAPPVQATLDQVDLRFEPHVLVVPAGSKVSFPNSDRVSHQVYSFSPVKRFDLPLYRGKAPAPVEFGQRGVATLGCNIHDLMRAYVFVVEAQHFGRTDADGSLKIADIAPGEYTVQIWHPLARDSRPLIDQRISVSAGTPLVTLRLATLPKLRPASQVPANWDVY